MPWSDDQGRSAKAMNRTAGTHALEKSDCAVVPVKQPNKGGQPQVAPFCGGRGGKGRVWYIPGLAKLAEKQEAEQFEPGEFVAQGDKVVALGHYRWRIKSTGHSYASDWAHVFTIHNGKVSNFEEYLDTYAWAAAYCGAQPSEVL